jgi:OOP family OmpA-OmpF porin
MRSCSSRRGPSAGVAIRSACVLALCLAWGVPAVFSQSSDDDKDRKAGAVWSQRGGSGGGWHAGVRFGTAKNRDFVSANNDGSLSKIDANESDVSWSLFGGYDFNQYVGVEVGYVDLGKTDFSAESEGGPSWSPGKVSTEFEGNGATLTGRGRLPLSERWALFAKLGIFRWNTKETFRESYGTTVDENSGTDAVYGAGVEYDPGQKDKWVWRAEVARTEVDDDGDKVDTASAALVYNF